MGHHRHLFCSYVPFFDILHFFILVWQKEEEREEEEEREMMTVVLVAAAVFAVASFSRLYLC